MGKLIHADKYQPRIFPIEGSGEDAEIDRAQDITPDITANRIRVEELGTTGAVGHVEQAPSIGWSLTQVEYGSMEFWQKITNQLTSDDAITLSDFRTAYSDICGYITDTEDTFIGTAWYPRLRVNGFSISIASPEDLIQRSFDLVGDEAVIWRNLNKYFIAKYKTVESGSDNTVDLSARTPAEDPDNSGTYIIRVAHYDDSAGTTSILTTDDYSYDSDTEILTISATVETDDVIKVYHTSAVAPATIFSSNTSDLAGILADSADVYLYVPASATPSSSNKITKIQSVTIDTSFDRADFKEVGKAEVVQRGINNQTVNVSLGQMIEDYSIEEALRNGGADYSKLDVSQFSNEIAVIVKIYSNSDKDTFKYGFKSTGLALSSLGGGIAVDGHLNDDISLTGEDLTITSNESTLGI